MRTIFKNCSLLDGTRDMAVRENIDVAIENDKIVEIGKIEQKKEDKKIIGWRCKICNYVYEGSNLPEDFTCPLCGHGADDFEPIYETA